MKTNIVTITDLADAYTLDLFNLRPNSKRSDYDINTLEGRREFFRENGVYALGKLNGKHYAKFEHSFNRTLDQFQAIWFAAMMFLHNRTLPEELREDIAEVTYDDDTNTYYTPAGKLEGSPDGNMTACVAFLFSCFGRVVDENEDGTYELESVSMDEMLEIIDPAMLSNTVTANDGADGFVWRVLRAVRGFSTHAVGSDVEALDDDPKNSTQDSENSKPTKSTSKRSTTKK